MYKQSNVVENFYVAGYQFADGPFVADKLAPGKKLKLVAEPDNPHDAEAVALYRKGMRVGYVPRLQNTMISQLLNTGNGDVMECVVVSYDPTSKPWESLYVSVRLKRN